MIPVLRFITRQTKEDAVVAQRLFIVVRVVGGVVVSIVSIFLWRLRLLDFNPYPVLFSLFLFYIGINVVWLIFLRSNREYPALSHIQLVIDIVSITLGVHFSGGLHSEFTLLYLVPVISATIISLQASLSAALTAAGLYGVLLSLEVMGFIPTLYPEHAGFQNDEIVRVLIFLAIMAIVTFQSYYFISQIRKRDKNLLKAKNDFLFQTVHALRTPLTTLRWIVEKYRSGSYQADNSMIQQDAAAVEKLNSQMNDLVNGLVIIAKEEGLTNPSELLDKK